MSLRELGFVERESPSPDGFWTLLRYFYVLPKRKERVVERKGEEDIGRDMKV